MAADSLQKIADDAWSYTLERSIELRAKFGLPVEHLPDITFAETQRNADFARMLLHRLDAVQPANEDERLTAAIVRSNSERAIEEVTLFWYRSPATPYSTPLFAVHNALQRIPDRARPLAEMPRFVDDLLGVLREQERRGIRVPKDEIPAVREMLAGLATSLSPEIERLGAHFDDAYFAEAPADVGLSVGEQLMSHVRRIEPQVPRFFARTPNAPYGVKRLDAEFEGGATFGYYQVPTAADPVGRYVFNGSQLSERNQLFAAAMIAHELIPGHHFQIARQEENESLPMLRRQAFETAYQEGWGEYAAYLGTEMGLYDDPYDRAGRLMMDAMLSTRLVVDTGMNVLGWPRKRAMDYMRKHTMLSETEIATETLRYAADIPAQALAYKIGSLKMIELRALAQRELGSRFDIRQFHEWIIGSGAMPLDVLEEHVRHEVASAAST